MVCRRSSSGKYSKESQRWASSRRFKVWWETYSVNLSSSQTGSSSFQCTATLHGKQKETKSNVKTIHRQLRIMLAKFPRGHWSFLGPGSEESGTELTLTNPTDHGINLQRIWWHISQDLVSQYLVLPVLLREENYEAKEEERSQYTSMVAMKPSSCFSAQWFLRITSVSTEQQQICATKVPTRFWALEKPSSNWAFGKGGNS